MMFKFFVGLVIGLCNICGKYSDLIVNYVLLKVWVKGIVLCVFSVVDLILGDKWLFFYKMFDGVCFCFLCKICNGVIMVFYDRVLIFMID